MNQLTIDATQLANWDFMSQLPTQIPSGRGRKPLNASETSTLKSALHMGSTLGLSNLFKTAEEVVAVGSTAVTTKILSPAKSLISSTVAVRVSSSTSCTAALAVAVSASVIGTALGSAGVYGSSTREVGLFSSVGAGVTFNTAGASVGGELTLIMGTPSDFAGKYYGLAVNIGTGVSGGGTLLFAPTTGGTPALVLTFMGMAFNMSASTPTKLPVSITIEVTDTRIKGVKF